MHKSIILTLLCLWCISITAQKADDPVALIEEDTLQAYTLSPELIPNRNILNDFFSYKYRNNINVYGDFYSNSTSITNSFANALIFKEFIEDELKDGVSKNIKGNERIGAELNAGVSFARRMQDSSLFLIKYKYNNLYSAKYPGDLFELVFRGNAFFEEKKANLAELNFKHLTYTQLQAGYIKAFNSGKNMLYFGGLISINHGSNFIDFNIERGSLYTAADGEYVDYDLKMDGYFSDTSKFNEFSFNGIGASADLFFNYAGAYNIKVEVQDIGFISWNDETARITSDTAFRFEGIEINSIVNAADPFEELNSDSLFSIFGIEYTEGSKSIMLPLTLKVSVSRMLNSSFMVTTGLQHRLFDNFSPLVYVKADKVFPKIDLNTAVLISYGGYGGLNAGVEVGKKFGERIGFRIGSPSLISYFAPKSIVGSSAYVLGSLSF